MDEKGLGKRLQEVRQTAGFTQQALCQKAGLSYSTLAKIERGAIKAPSIFTIRQIAGVLGVSLDELIGQPAITDTKSKQKSKSGISFVYFDVNGCLVRFYQRAFTTLAESLGLRSDVVETAFWHYNDEICRGDITMPEFNAKLAKQIGVETGKVDWQKHYLEAVDPIPEMHELVSWAEEHFKIGLLSNIMPGLIDAMVKSGSIPDIKYDVIVDSSQIGIIKPDKRVFEIAQQKAAVPADEILLIDDNRANVTAAERQGWHVLWFDDYRPSESAQRVRTALELP